MIAVAVIAFFYLFHGVKILSIMFLLNDTSFLSDLMV